MWHNIAFLDFSTLDLLIILAILLLLFGGRKIPELSRSFGKSLNEFKKGVDNKKDASKEDEKKKPPTNAT